MVPSPAVCEVVIPFQMVPSPTVCEVVSPFQMFPSPTVCEVVIPFSDGSLSDDECEVIVSYVSLSDGV